MGGQKKESKEELVQIKNQIVSELKECLPVLIKSQLDSCQVEIAKEEKVPAIKHSLVLKPNDDNKEYSPKTWAEAAKTLPQKLQNLPVERSVYSDKGYGCLSFPSKESRDLAAESLKNDFEVQKEDRNTKTVYPKIKISGINKEQFSKHNVAELREEVLKKNAGVRELVGSKGKIFEVLFINEKTEQKYAFAVAKVDPEIKEVIRKNGNKLFVGLSACRVSDRVHILQCYTCQEFGHKVGSHRCSLKDKDIHVCLYCSSNHMSRDCPVKKCNDRTSFKCSNCSKSPNPNIRKGAVGHTTISHDCPVLQKELSSLLSRTIGMSPSTTLPKNAIIT